MAAQGIWKGFSEITADPPMLRGLTEIEFIKDVFSTLEDEGVPKQPIQAFEARTLRKHLRKTVLEYTVKFGNSTERSYIGLHRESDKRLEHTFSILGILKENGFNETSTLRVPAPITYIPSLSFLMMEKAEGETLRTIFDTPETDPTPFASLAALWLAKLHRSKVIFQKTKNAAEEIAASLKYSDALVNQLPNFSQAIGGITEKLLEKQELSRFEPKPIHGDYHPRNIIISPSNQAMVIDFEESCMGDPAFDLGYFIAQTKMSHGIRPEILQAMSMFLDEYARASPPDDHQIFERARMHEAQTYLQRIYHTYVLLGLKPQPGLISLWLEESEKCLENG